VICPKLILEAILTFFNAIMDTHPLTKLICTRLRCDSEAYLCNTMSLYVSSLK
jgi:hypothetical protein